MTSPSLPRGRHLVAFNQVRTVAGGQTHALLQRTRFFAEHAGISSTILTFDAFPDYALIEADLRERGKLHADVALRNIYDHYRDLPWDLTAAGDEKLPGLEDLRKLDEPRSDGSLWRTRYEDPVTLRPVCYDYHRANGSVFMRSAPLSMDEFPQQPDLIQVVDESGLVRASFATQGEFFGTWVNQLGEQDPEGYLFIDSMMLPPHISAVLDPKIYQIAVLHMAHVYHPRMWNSPQHPPAERSLEHLDRFDALVVLTERQRQDIELRYGARNNMFVLPNPAEPATPPEPLPDRDPTRISMIARHERVKRVDHAIRAFAQVVEEEPKSVLDVYGDGSLRSAHQKLIDQLGIGSSVTLHGHRPDATDRLWESSGLVVTSRSEGYPLAPLEAMMRGCPVICYDIKYGPREQVHDEENGYLVPAGDIERLAHRILDLIRKPADVARMGAHGREQTLADRAAYVDHWADVLAATSRARSHRVSLDEVTLTVEHISKPMSVWSRMLGVVRSSRSDFSFRGRLSVVASGAEDWVDDARLALDAVDDVSGDLVTIPLEVRHEGVGDFDVDARADLRKLLSHIGGASPRVALRLSLTVRNAYWETLLRRPRALDPRREITFLDDGQVRVRARRGN